MKKNDLLQDIQRDIDEQIDKCKIYNCSIERLESELAEINDNQRNSCEIIDILATERDCFKTVPTEQTSQYSC